MTLPVLVSLLLAVLTTGCALLPQGAELTPQSLAQTASAWPLQIAEGTVYTDNDAAFASKLRMIEGARASIDLSYYIFTDDESSAKLIQALLDATRRGVTVRLLVDYATNYNDLDLLSMMEADGGGRLHVRLYNRPTPNIIKDAVFLTMGCAPDAAPHRPTECSDEKFAAVDKLFADRTVGGVTNVNAANSGLLLSGLYAKRADVVALAVQQGQGIDPHEMSGRGSSLSTEEKERLKKLGEVYWNSRTAGPFQRLESKAELFFAFSMYGQQLNPLKETLTSVLPINRTFGADEIRDWDHFTDYTHHKFLLVDRRVVQLGGRNVENSYHMHPDPLIRKYVFMDTDLAATLGEGGDAVDRSFDDLWNFLIMVAPIDEVRQHAPNDFVVNLRYAERACAAAQRDKPAHEQCVQREMQTDVHDLAERMADARKTVAANARTYDTRYTPTPHAQASPSFALDKGSLLGYLENLPFDKRLSPEQRERLYGAPAGKEGVAKHIHDVWLRELPRVCAEATRENPQRIILHNAYFFPPANLTYAFSRLMDGTYDCSNVTVSVLTNSIETTDLSVVNLAARHVLKAFTEFYQQHSNPARRAAFEYYEYQRPPSGPSPSLHTKVSVFGDDVIVGSANADVRSFVMDSNNAMIVRNAPEFARTYRAYLQGILADPARSKKLNDYFLTTPRSTIVQEDLAVFRQILAKYGVDKRVSPEQEKVIEGAFVEMLDDVYRLTRDSISPDLSASKRRESQDKFNELFKPI